MDWSRTELLVGREGIIKLQEASVAVYGLGGVGGYALEALVRAGIGSISVIDYDSVHPSNLNRQLLATERTLGMKKTTAALERIREIHPSARARGLCSRITPENLESMIPDDIGYAVDAIDELDAKIALIMALRRRGVVSIHSMGAGNKLSPAGVMIADIGVTTHCPLARRVRRKLNEEGIRSGVACVYSEESPRGIAAGSSGERSIGSISHVPGLFGLTAAGYIIQRILEG